MGVTFVVMWFLFSKHYTNEGPEGNTSNWIFSGESVCVVFVSYVLVCAREIVCGGI